MACVLPKGLRGLLARPPPGALLVSTSLELARFSHRIVGAVGDYVVRLLLGLGVRPRLLVYDCLNMRRETACPEPPPVYEVHLVSNPRSTLSPEAVRLVASLLRSDGYAALRVDGEEDLLTLAVLLYSPQGALVAYGAPGLATVLAPVTRWVKLFAARVMEDMGCRAAAGIPL